MSKDVNLDKLYRRAERAKKARKVVNVMEVVAENFFPALLVLCIGGGILFCLGYLTWWLWTIGLGWLPIIMWVVIAFFITYGTLDAWSESTIKKAHEHRVWD